MIIKSLQMALSSLIPLAVVFCAQIGVRITYGDDAALALGTAGNILGIVVSLSVGCFVLSLRNSVESLKRVGRDDAPRVRESLSVLWLSDQCGPHDGGISRRLRHDADGFC